MKRICSILLIAILIFTAIPFSGISAFASTAEFAGGSGTASDPYLIETKYHLNNVRNHLDAHYKMIADIEFTDSDFAEGGAFCNNGCGWAPLGDDFENPFYGEFDGNDHLISNLNCSSNKQWSGLFGYNLGEIKNLVISQCNISSSNNYHPFIGGIVGVNGGDIYNCKTLDSVIINDNTNGVGGIVGGICGENDGTISNCITSGQVSGITAGGICGSSQGGTINNCVNRASIYFDYQTELQEFSCEIGGIVGFNGGIVTQCKNNGNISANLNAPNNSDEIWYAASAGGIIGRNETEGTISECHNNGSVSSKSITLAYTGGIVAFNRYSKVENCYNSGTIASNDLAGGIIGFNEGGTISNCYNVGKNDTAVLSATYVGGICGKSYYSNIFDCYYLNDIQLGIGIGDGLVDSSSNLELREQKTFKNFDFNSVWEFTEGNAYLYPTLQNIEHFVIDEGLDFNGGNGTEQSPYLIASTKQLDNVRKNLSAHYKLVRNIEFVDADFTEGGDFYNHGQGWVPIGADSTSPFTGHFDGNNRKISNLYINITLTPRNYQIFAGLFGYGNGCQISNLSLNGSNITVDVKSDAVVCVGTILGRTDEFGSGAIITNCTNDGEIYASEGTIGGIAGSFEKGSITGCKNYGSINTNAAGVGGIIGYLRQGTITECQNYSVIESNSNNQNNCGGIVANVAGDVVSCSNYGNITSSCEAGGIACSNWGRVDNCRNDGKITAKYSAGGIVSVSAAMSNNVSINAVTNCINTGMIISGISSDDMYFIKSGGIAGSIQDGIKISNSWNHGTVLSQSESGFDCHAGGIVGYNSGGSILRCGNTGNVSVKTERYARGGGIVGCNCGGNIPVIVDQCVNQGAIYSPNGDNGVCGGIAGDNFNTATISNCFNIGPVTSSSRPGGILGLTYDDTVRVVQCYNAGTLTTLTPNSWIVGEGRPATENCYYLDSQSYTTTVIPGYVPGTALTSEEMKNPVNFCGFDFENIWTMQGSDCYPYPELKNVKIITDHIYEAVCDTTCTCGYTRVVPDHIYNNACDTECNICGHVRSITHAYDNPCDKDCNVCGATRATEHKYTDACDKTCNICGAPRTAPHSFGDYIYNDDATCSADGTKTRTCSICGKKETVKATGTKLVDSSEKFTDVKANEWYKPYIDYAVTYKVLNGSGNKMNPNANITRAEFVQVLANLSGVDTSNKKVNAGFVDVKSGAWYAPAVKWASENGIAGGIGGGKFAPEDQITREQMCTMLIRYIKGYLKIEPQKTVAYKKFADDAQISDWAKEYVYICQQAGFVNGVSPTQFAPNESANRASVATIMTRFHKQYL